MDKFNAIESESPRKRKRRSHDDDVAPIDGVNQQPALQFNYASASHSAASPNHSTPLRNFGWVEKSHFATIASGTFDVNNLPQLLHDEDARRNHLTQTIHGVIFKIESGESQIVREMTDFQASFPNIETFISAFVVYSAISTTHYTPARIWVTLYGLVGKNSPFCKSYPLGQRLGLCHRFHPDISIYAAGIMARVGF